MSDEQKPIAKKKRRHGWQFWGWTGLFLFLVPYPLSIGPAAWLVEHGYLKEESLGVIYLPLRWFFAGFPEWINDMIIWYVKLWVSPDFK